MGAALVVRTMNSLRGSSSGTPRREAPETSFYVLPGPAQVEPTTTFSGRAPRARPDTSERGQGPRHACRLATHGEVGCVLKTALASHL